MAPLPPGVLAGTFPVWQPLPTFPTLAQAETSGSWEVLVELKGPWVGGDPPGAAIQWSELLWAAREEDISAISRSSHGARTQAS